jgi:hypothetical protein
MLSQRRLVAALPLRICGVWSLQGLFLRSSPAPRGPSSRRRTAPTDRRPLLIATSGAAVLAPLLSACGRDYGAEGCEASRSQAARTREFEQRCRSWMEALRMLTSAEPRGLPSRSDAITWAACTGLPPTRVLHAPLEADMRIVPQHLLMGPAGTTQFRWIGVLEVGGMLDIAIGFRDGTRQPKLRLLPAR